MNGSKWKSRKFLLAVQATVVGLVILVLGAVAGDTVKIVSGAAIELAALLGYLTAEGAVDRERAKKQ